MDLGLGHRSCARDPPRNGAERTRTRPDWRGGVANSAFGASGSDTLASHARRTCVAARWRFPRLRRRRPCRRAARPVSPPALARATPPSRRSSDPARESLGLGRCPLALPAARDARGARRWSRPLRARPCLVASPSPGRPPSTHAPASRGARSPASVPGRRRRLLRARYPSRRARRRARFPSPARHHGRGVGQTAARVQPELPPVHPARQGSHRRQGTHDRRHGAQKRGTAQAPPGQPPPEDKYLINMEMLGRHPDMEEPKWRSMKQMSTSEFHRVLRDGEAKMFQVWDPPQRNEKFPQRCSRSPSALVGTS